MAVRFEYDFCVMPANMLGTLGKFGSGHARVEMVSLGVKFVLQPGIRLWQNHKVQKVCEYGYIALNHITSALFWSIFV